MVQQQGDIYTFDTAGAGNAFVPKGVSWDGDYAFKTSYMLAQGLLAFSFGATQNGRYYVAVNQDAISLVKEDAAGSKTVLTQAEAPEPAMQHCLTMAKQNGIIQVYVDKTLWLAYQDAAPLSAGTIIVGSTDGTTAWVDDVLVNKIGKVLTQKAPAVAAVDPSQVVAPPDDDTDLTQIDEAGDEPDLNDNNHPDDILQPVVSFTVRADADSQASDSASVTSGSQVILEWNVENAQQVFFLGNPVPSQATRSPHVVEDTVYELEVTGLDGVTQSYYAGVAVTDNGDGNGNDGDGDGGNDGVDGALLGPNLAVAASVSLWHGSEVAINWTVANYGDVAAEAVVRFYAHESEGVVSLEFTRTMAPGSSYSADWYYDYGQHGTMHWMITVDDDELVADTNRGNNTNRGEITIEP